MPVLPDALAWIAFLVAERVVGIPASSASPICEITAV